MNTLSRNRSSKTGSTNRSTERVVIAFAVVLGLSTIGSAELLAQDVTQDHDAEARTLFAEGQKHYDAGGYEKSVELFTKAFELSKKPLLLFNIANAQERLGNYDKAVEALERYVASPDVADKEAVRERIAHLERRSAEQKADLERDLERERARERELAEARAAVETGPVSPTSSNSPADVQPSAVPGWVLIGVGGALIVGGSVSGVLARSASGDAEEQCNSGGVCPASAESDIDRAKRLALVSDLAIATGVVAAAVGGYLLFRRSKSNLEAKTVQVNVGPTAEGDGIYAGLSGSF